MNYVDNLRKKQMGGDARSTRGIISRGANRYGAGGSSSAKQLDLRSAAKRAIQPGESLKPNELKKLAKKAAKRRV